MIVPQSSEKRIATLVTRWNHEPLKECFVNLNMPRNFIPLINPAAETCRDLLKSSHIINIFAPVSVAGVRAEDGSKTSFNDANEAIKINKAINKSTWGAEEPVEALKQLDQQFQTQTFEPAAIKVGYIILQQILGQEQAFTQNSEFWSGKGITEEVLEIHRKNEIAIRQVMEIVEAIASELHIQLPKRNERRK